jgi:alanyl-tRNA synthetase
MNSKEIREKFLAFFKNKEHEIVASAPMVIKNDPTLMFTNAGMNQFKDLFLGNTPVSFPRIANTQKCLRVSGKHNDLEEVGVDTYHHTMFEMLGNWSFGNYFKKEAIEWAWELLTEIYKLDKNKLYVTVFEGSLEDKLDFDTEAFEYWKKFIPENRILKGNKKDNFWEMGDTGPCGPCSEIHIDLRSNDEKNKISGDKLVNTGHPQVIEIWNLVFMQFNRMANGDLTPLPAKHVDTGMGFERLCMALQNKTSNYDTDVFMPYINELEKICSLKYLSSSSKQDIAFRVIADHLRAISFSIADGQLPSNTGAGYVIRRILRRAVRYGYSFLTLKEPFIYRLVPSLVYNMGDSFPELNKQESLIIKVILEEEESFLRTLEQGISRFEKYKNEFSKSKIIKGTFAFELYDTFGFPIDLTQLLAKEIGFTIDMEDFNLCLQQQKERSRAASKIETDDWVELSDYKTTDFVGYDSVETEINIIRYRKIKIKDKELFQLVFDKTPFYPEGGGQVGDSGFIEYNGLKTYITNTKKENNLIIHFTEKLPNEFNVVFVAHVDTKKRIATAKNHSATHLLHHALRKILGTHVEQKGSLVNSEYLRFDFSHFQKVTDEELKQIELLVNEAIANAYALEEMRNTPIKDAEKLGAMMLFGEKYGDTVRVIKFGNSVELCGGIHVKNSSQIALFKIVSESSVAAGVRRIEAITSQKAEEFINSKLQQLDNITTLLKNPKDLLKSIQDLIIKNEELQKKLDNFLKEKAKIIKGELKNKLQTKNDVHFYIGKIEFDDAASLKDISFQLMKEYNNLFLVLATETENKPAITVVISEQLAKQKNLHAGNIVKELAKEIKGGGGGQAFYATAGGTDSNGLSNIFEKAKNILQ